MNASMRSTRSTRAAAGFGPAPAIAVDTGGSGTMAPVLPTNGPGYNRTGPSPMGLNWTTSAAIPVASTLATWKRSRIASTFGAAASLAIMPRRIAPAAILTRAPTWESGKKTAPNIVVLAIAFTAGEDVKGCEMPHERPKRSPPSRSRGAAAALSRQGYLQPLHNDLHPRGRAAQAAALPRVRAAVQRADDGPAGLHPVLCAP